MNPQGSVARRFDLMGRVAVITGGSGLLGREHAIALAECGADPVLLDINEARLANAVVEVRTTTGVEVRGLVCCAQRRRSVRRFRSS
jgi:NAD(P)-dependent dehydrogenase (short-subunit alcohol dehydrogenase family)